MNFTNFSILFAFLLIALLFSVRPAFAKNDPLAVSDCPNADPRHQSDVDANKATWEGCRFQRGEVISWMDKGFDIDNDGYLSMWECEYARNYYFNPVELMFGESCETVFKRCDCDGDKLIDYNDFTNSWQTCLANCNAAKRIWFFIGSRLPTEKAFDGLAEADHSIDKGVLNQ